MAGVSIDHIVSVVVLLAAVLLFFGLFNQTLSVAVDYQRNTSTAQECSNLLDAILLTPGVPTSGNPTMFGLQDPALSQYQLSTFSLMRLNSLSSAPISYQKTGLTYSTITTSPNNYLLSPDSDVINYSTALMLLGINGTYGFQLSLTPTVNISIAEISTSPLTLSLNATGTGFPLANANVNCLLIPVYLNTSYPDFETIANQMQTVETNSVGSASVTFSSFSLNPNLTYAFIAYAYDDGITGVGYYQHPSVGNQSIVPFLGSLSTQSVTLAHSDDIPTNSTLANTLHYNTTFILESQNYAVQETPMGSSNAFGNVTSGTGYSPVSISMGSYTPGILVIGYDGAGSNGVAMMPWGFSSLGFSLVFGGTPINQKWIATDLRQVQINGVSYQAKLSLWSTQGYQEAG
ncbi:MAG: hypothetical protein ABSA75_04985 [Candidatus Bathyarchaeia archaeon]